MFRTLNNYDYYPNFLLLLSHIFITLYSTITYSFQVSILLLYYKITAYYDHYNIIIYMSIYYNNNIDIQITYYVLIQNNTSQLKPQPLLFASL